MEKEAKRLARSAKANPWIEQWMRVGYMVRGLLYGVVGFLAIQLVLTGRGNITDRTGALATIAVQPFGKLLLIVMAIGVTGYALWSLLRAILNPFTDDHSLAGTLTRVGYLITGISYGALVIPITRLILGAGQPAGSDTQQAQQVATGLFTHPWGPWLVGLVGIVIFGVGLVKMYQGWTEKFEHQFKGYRMTAEQKRWAMRMGKLGTLAQGVVLATVGSLSVLAAVTLDPHKVGGMDQALAFLIQQAYGPWLLGLVAAGLIAYAAYSLMGAMWFKIREL
jgi:hypothetical protein